MSEDAPAPTSSHRFFRAPEHVYDGAREFFISVFHQPRNGTSEPFPAYADPRTVKDKDGFAYVALLNSECDWPEVTLALQNMIDAEQIEEVSPEDFAAALPVSQP
jgi:hypothetical protein